MIYTNVRTVNSGHKDERRVIGLKKDGTENSLEIVQLIAKDDMYRKGLQKDFKNLVEMGSIADHLAGLLQAYIDTNRMTEAGWVAIMKAFEPFIDKKLRFDLVTQFMEDPTHKGAWE